MIDLQSPSYPSLVLKIFCEGGVCDPVRVTKVTAVTAPTASKEAPILAKRKRESIFN
ncbi:hypothetical protein [Mycoplasma wenyonii]|uniref:hypothetical protein n=1 Tax=Mycoplasma wenyonii TaxID=65123 RepID=UPI0015EB407A|nr:hypothetical protein [Mycoplasma wenyonii]